MRYMKCAPGPAAAAALPAAPLCTVFYQQPHIPRGQMSKTSQSGGDAGRQQPPGFGKCPHCYREFTNLRHHINQQHMQVKNYKCASCGYSCYLKTDLERHILNVHDKFRIPCDICGKKYSDLRQHVRIVHEGAKRECPHCKGQFANLVQHINKVHKRVKNAVCDRCGQTFYHSWHLNKHMEVVHKTKAHEH